MDIHVDGLLDQQDWKKQSFSLQLFLHTAFVVPSSQVTSIDKKSNWVLNLNLYIVFMQKLLANNFINNLVNVNQRLSKKILFPNMLVPTE